MESFDVLFVCVGNSARSQMAKGFYNAYAKRTSAESAGTEPAKAISSKAVKVMRELGIDISGEKPKLLTPEMVIKARRIITMGCLSRSSCPSFLLSSGGKIEDWALPDPKGRGIEEYRRVRDKIKEKVLRLVEEMDALLPSKTFKESP